MYIFLKSNIRVIFIYFLHVYHMQEEFFLVQYLRSKVISAILKVTSKNQFTDAVCTPLPPYTILLMTTLMVTV